MKKHLFIIGILMGLSLGTFAQNNKQTFDATVSLGFKGGINMPRMLYFHNTTLSQLPQAYSFTPTGGLFFDIPLGRCISLVPEADYVQRGTDITYIHKPSGATVHYSLSASYVDLRLPVELFWPIKPYFQPYLSVGVEAGIRLFGQIHIDRSNPIALDMTVDVGDANLSLIHAGAFAGVGIRSKIGLGRRDIMLKLSASIHQGVLDTYTAKEKEGAANPMNVNAYQIMGQRLPQGLEVCLGISIPLKHPVDDACATFSHDRYRRHGRGKLFGY